ncbi:MAG TPA: hypothetical protein VG269_26820 [Tepidisphaeraceae bacterium]|nr:hypothetical protein [Tepidisphaeraceae bacterium]
MPTTRVHTQDLSANSVATADVQTAAVTFAKLALAASNPCLEDDGSGNAQVKVDGLIAGVVQPGGTITRVSGGLALQQAPAALLTGVTGKGSLLAGTGTPTGTAAVLAAGGDGQQLFADSSQSAGLRWEDPLKGFRNKLINADFDWSQRFPSGLTLGAGQTITATAFYIMDRWITYTGTGGFASITQQTFTNGQTAVPGEPAFSYHHVQGNALASTNPGMEQRIDGVRTLAGKTATISFYAKASASLTVSLTLTQVFGTGGSANNLFLTQPFTLTTAYQRFSVTVAVPTLAGKTIGTNHCLSLILAFPSATAFTIDIARPQVEEGSIATPFEQRPYEIEAVMLARYYWKSYAYGVTPGTASAAAGLIQTVCAGTGTADTLVQMVYFPTHMRVAPAVTLYSFAGVTGQWTLAGSTPTAIVSSVSEKCACISNSTVGTDGSKGIIHATADAEL